MSSVSMASSLPRTEVLGFKDVSGRGQPLEIADLPIFLPWSPLFTAWGPSDSAKLVSGAGFTRLYGSSNFNAGSPFLSHQAAMVQKVFQAGGMALVRRMKPAGAKTATLRIWLDMVPDKVPQYVRNVDGSIRLTDGVPTEIGSPVDGITYRFHVEHIDEDDVGKGEAATGELVNADGQTSTMYPIIDTEARFFGAAGNNLGFRLVAPTTLSNPPVNADLIEEKGAYLYRISMMQRSSENTSGVLLNTMDAEPYVEFTLKKKVLDEKTNTHYGFDKKVLKAYEDNDPQVFAGYGPLKTFHVYDANVQLVLDALYAVEKDHGLITATVSPEHTINLFGCVDVNGIPYHALRMVGPLQGGALFGENATHWLRGGSDGDVSALAYDEAVRDELMVFGSGDVPYADRASHPMSAFVDSGFSQATKNLFGNIMMVRPDAYVISATQDVLRPLNTPEEDSNIGAAQRNRLAMIPESEFYNTGACRAVVMKHAGVYLDTEYDGILPFTVDFAAKLAAYMGGPRMLPGFAPDSGAYRIVSRFVDHNAKFRPVKPRNKDWQAGISSAEPFDHNGQVFFAGIQTIYHDNTSVLNSFFPMAICCHLNRLGELAWRMYTGDSRKTAAEYVSDVDRFLEGQIKDRYDGRADITPRSYYTAADARRGYSWHTDIEGLFDGAKTVQALTIVAGRRSEQESE